MLDVAFDELPRCGVQQVCAAEIRPGMNEREYVLKLIAKPEGASGLVRSAAGPDTTAQRLVQEPAIDDEIERIIGGPNLHDAERVIPHTLGGCERVRGCGE